MTAPWATVERLTGDHDLSAFETGETDIDEWFQGKAHRQQQENRCSTTVCCSDDREVIAAFAMLQVIVASAELSRKMQPNDGGQSTGLLLAKMGICSDSQGQGHSKHLMKLVLSTALEVHERSAFRLIVVDALTDDLIPFYERFGFKQTQRPRRLVMKVAEAQRILAA